ncbi:MAG: nuclear transport factor 2 family protein [Emcibacter sp.]|nr:nuclear transport factor 2 family protein [Emcibacter sp.]
MNQKIDLELEMRDLCARRDIHDAVCRYMRGLDRLDRVLNLSAFHDDAFVDCGMMKGSAVEFVDFAQGFLKEMLASQHFIGQVDLEIKGEKASGEVYFHAWHRIKEDGVEKDLMVGGRYIDEYACRKGEWRILKRAMIVDWSRTDLEADGFTKGNDAALTGQRGKSDFSYVRHWEK